MVKKLLSFDFLISRHFVAIFRNKSAFQNVVSLKSIDPSKSFFTSDSVLSCSFKIQYLFVKSLVEI